MMEQGELKALRERLEQDDGFIKFMLIKRIAARRKLERAALNRNALSPQQIEQVMADYAALTRLSHELLPKEKQDD